MEAACGGALCSDLGYQWTVWGPERWGRPRMGGKALARRRLAGREGLCEEGERAIEAGSCLCVQALVIALGSTG